MTGPGCGALDDVLDALASGETASPAQQAHLAGCEACQARLALARRIDRALATWPAPLPPRHFAAAISAAARQDAWRQELVVDWGFNIALAASLGLIVAGALAFVWVLGVAGGPPEASLTADAVASLLTRLRSQLPVVGTASVLLVATAAAWWWADARDRW